MSQQNQSAAWGISRELMAFGPCRKLEEGRSNISEGITNSQKVNDLATKSKVDQVKKKNSFFDLLSSALPPQGATYTSAEAPDFK